MTILRTDLTLEELRNMQSHLLDDPDSVWSRYVWDRISELEDRDTQVA